MPSIAGLLETALYVDDPDGHVIELATPGLWANY